jgi:hypothetical protein
MEVEIEKIFYFSVFVIIVAANIFLKKKKIFERFENYERKKEKHSTLNIHKRVRNQQKLSRKKGEKKISQVFSFEKKILTNVIKTENNNDFFNKNTHITFNRKILKEAVIFKEILDIPVSLR